MYITYYELNRFMKGFSRSWTIRKLSVYLPFRAVGASFEQILQPQPFRAYLQLSNNLGTGVRKKTFKTKNRFRSKLALVEPVEPISRNSLTSHPVGISLTYNSSTSRWHSLLQRFLNRQDGPPSGPHLGLPRGHPLQIQDQYSFRSTHVL